MAEDNLRIGRSVVSDCVNPLPETRNAWRSMVDRVGGKIVEVEVICSDAQEHRRRVELRVADIPGHVLPTWSEVQESDYQPWTDLRIVIDTASQTADQSVERVLSVIRTRWGPG